jgi:hypothetical protein
MEGLFNFNENFSEVNFLKESFSSDFIVVEILVVCEDLMTYVSIF